MIVSYKQHSFSGGMIDRTLMGRQDIQKYYDSASEITNFMVSKQGHVTKRRGTNFVASLKGLPYAVKESRLVPFSASKDYGYYILFIVGVSEVLGDDNPLLEAYVISPSGFLAGNGEWVRSVEDAEPLAGCYYEKLDELGFFQSGDTIFIAHRDYPFAKIYRTSDNAFTYKIINLTQLGETRIPPAPTNITTDGRSSNSTVSSFAFYSEGQSASNDKAYRGSRTIYYKVTAVIDGIESRPSEARAFTYNLPWQEKSRVTISWDSVPGAEYYNVYKKESSEYGLIGTTRDDNSPDEETGEIATTRTSVQDDYISPDLSVTPPKYERKFADSGKYPSCVALYQQRLALASTEDDPFTFWLSCVGDLYNFNEHTSLREDDAIEATIPATEFPNINHMVLSRDLILYCDNGMWVVSPSGGGELTYKTIVCHKQNSVGTSKRIAPQFCCDHIVSVDANGRTVRGGKYSYASDGLELQDLTAFSSDIFRNNPINSIAWQQAPNMNLWCACRDGSVAILTYMTEQNVCSWAKFTAGGGARVMDVACNKACIEGVDDVTMLVSVGVGESEHFEIWSVRPDSDNLAWDNQLCLDGVRRVRGSALTPEMVAAMKIFDGDNASQLQLLEDAAADKDYVCGYAFEASLTTVYPQTAGAESQQMRIHNLKMCDFRLVDSSGFYVVPACLRKSRQYWQKVDAPCKVDGGEIVPFTGDVTAVPYGVNNKDGRVSVIHDGIYPMTLTYIALDYSYEPDRGGK